MKTILSILLIALIVTMCGCINAPNEIDLTSTSEFSARLLYDVKVSGDYVYYGDYQDIVVLDSRDSANPQEIGRLSLSYYIYDIALEDNYAYLANGNRLAILDITDPAAPKLVGNYDIDGAVTVDVAGNYAYVVTYALSEGELYIINITNPTAPVLVDTFYTRSYIGEIDAVDSYVFIANGNDGLTIFDFTNPTEPKLAGSYDDGFITKVTVAGSYAYISNRIDGDEELVIIDVTNPTAPERIGSYPTEGCLHRITVADNYVYTGINDEFYILDITDPTTPELMGKYKMNIGSIDVRGNYMYANGYNVLEVFRIDKKNQ